MQTFAATKAVGLKRAGSYFCYERALLQMSG